MAATKKATKKVATKKVSTRKVKANPLPSIMFAVLVRKNLFCWRVVAVTASETLADTYREQKERDSIFGYTYAKVVPVITIGSL